MRNLRRPVAVVLAITLVAITPLFAYADAVKKDQLAINDQAVLNQVESIMKSTDFSDLNHGGIVSAANADFDNLAKNTQLLKDLGINSNEKLTRGKLISILARTAPKGGGHANANDNKDSKDSQDSSDESGGGQGKDNKGNHGKPDTAVTTADETATATPTATVTPTTVTTQTTATATETPTSETPTATATPEPRGRSGDAPGHTR